MPRIFLSYADQDKSIAEKIALDLRKSGIDVWFDQWALKVGDSLLDKIRTGINRSDFLAVLLSPHSVRSKWVEQEINMAFIRELERREAVLLPILIEECDLPRILATRKYADFRKSYEYGLKELLKAIPTPPSRHLSWEKLSGKDFERFVALLLEKEGFSNVHEFSRGADRGVGIIAEFTTQRPGEEFEKQKWVIECKHYRSRKVTLDSLHQLIAYATTAHADAALLVTSSEPTITAIQTARRLQDFSGRQFVIWDRSKLDALVSKHPDLATMYFGVEIQAVLEDTDCWKFVERMVHILAKIRAGIRGWKQFENVCIEILNFLFIPPLGSPKIRARSFSGIDVRDAIYPNRAPDGAWKYYRQELDAKYVVFDFKNYDKEDLNKDDVNQVRNYLKKTLGRFGFLCSTKPPTQSALLARNQAYAEEKKVILFLTTTDLVEMMRRKCRGEDSCDVIPDLLDEFYICYE